MAQTTRPSRVAVIGAPFNSAGLPGGVARAPLALRQAGLIEILGERADARDAGDVPIDGLTRDRDQRSGIIAVPAVVSLVLTLRKQVGDALAQDRFPLVIGGDCTVLLGCLAAARDAHGRVGLLFVDGHEDAYPPHLSPTGEAADMELGLALGRDTAGLPPALAELLPLALAGDVALFGPRDAAELEQLRVLSLAGLVEQHDSAALQRGDIRAATHAALSRIRRLVAGWWLHVDLDVLSTEALPAVDYQQPSGLGWDQLDTLVAAALSVPGLVGWSVACYNPDLDVTGSGATRICSAIGRAAAVIFGPESGSRSG